MKLAWLAQAHASLGTLIREIGEGTTQPVPASVYVRLVEIKERIDEAMERKGD